MTSKAFFFAFLLYVVAVFLRLYPFFLSGLPFSVDSWAPIRNTELLLEESPVYLGDDRIFDSYNNYWPANSLFGAAVSEITGLQPIMSMAVFLPVVGATAIPMFYALISKLYGQKISLLASLIFATVFTHIIMTAGVTKETFANPVYLLLLAIFLHPTIGGGRRIMLFSLVSLTLVLAHHYTTLVTLTVLFWLATAEFLQNVRKGQEPRRRVFVLVSVLALIAASYYEIYAYKGFRIELSMADWLSAGSYQITFFAAAWYSTSHRKPSRSSRKISIAMGVGVMVAAFLFTLLATRKPLVPGAPVLPPRYFLYSLPLLLASPLVVIGLRNIPNVPEGKSLQLAPFFWLASILAIEAYSILSNATFGLLLAYRTVNFLWPPLAVFCAAGVIWMIETAEKRKTRLHVPMTVLGLTFASLILASNSYNVYAAISLQERYMGYFWLYTPAEYRAATWTSQALKDQLIAGDVKVAYLLNGYFNLQVDPFLGLRYLSGKSPEPEVLYTYSQMMKNGYVVYGGYSVDLSEDWIEKTYDLDIVYANGMVNICHGEEDS